MSIVSTYRRWLQQLTQGVDFLSSGLGASYVGVMAATTDGVQESARQSFLQGLPGHPEQLIDGLNQVGADRSFFRFRGESQSSWSSRVQNSWTQYEQAGTDIQVLRALNEWAAIVFPGTYSPGHFSISEGSFATFTVIITAGLLPWTAGATYGGGEHYGDGTLYGLASANLEDIETLRRIIRKWKPARSKALLTVNFTGGGSATISV